MKQLRLNTLANARRTYARILRARFNEEIDRETYRDLVYGFSTFIGMWKLESMESLQERMDAIEATLKERGVRGIA